MVQESKGALNIRGLSKKLVWRCKEEAAAQKKTLKQFVRGVLEEATRQKSRK